MKSSEVNKVLQDLAEILHEDFGRAEHERRYPQQALPALHDERVLRALRNKLEQGQSINAIVPFGYSPFTRLNHTLLILGKADGQDLPVGILVITDYRSHVVGVVEDFEIPEPGTTIRLPVTYPSTNQPFVLRQPSAAEQMLHVGVPLIEPWIPNPGGQPVPWPGPGGGFGFGGGRLPGRGGVTANTTTCTYETTTQTLIGRSCKQVTVLFVPTCDAWGNDYVADTQADTEVDDSGEDSLFGPGLNFPW